MPRGTKARKIATMSRAVVAENVRWRLAAIYGAKENPTMELAVDARLSHSTVQRVLASSVGASVDILESLAKALDCSIAELFEPSEQVMRALGVVKADSAKPRSRRAV